MDIREQTLNKYKELNEHLLSIDLNQLRQHYTRQELDEFKSELNGIKLRSLAYEISKITKQIKEKEYPDLLGVHHFPIINEIDFLPEKTKIDLDSYLLKHRVGNFVYSFWKVVPREDSRKQLEQWLEEKGVIEKHYAVICPNCYERNISKFMTPTEKETLEKMFKQYKTSYDNESYEYLSKVLDNGCSECDDWMEFEDMEELRFKDEYKMMMEKDTSLDNV